jgi:glycosyltransferase involved in cell wall biosynthesis
VLCIQLGGELFVRCPSIKDIPSPTVDKSGWPWIEETSPLPDIMPDGKPWPRISIITPSYNQGQFIEETIRSVLLQGYPNLEYIIIDGGSTDNSVEVIKKYERWLAYWVSEPDKGQSAAINKGWKKSTGEILAWLNSDDLYFPHALNTIVKYFSMNPDSLVVYGNCDVLAKNGKRIDSIRNVPFNAYRLLYFNYIPQPSLFLRKRIFDKVELLDSALHYIMDWDLLLRVAITLKKKEIGYFPKTLSCLRMYHGCKTVSASFKIIQELQKVYDKLASKPIPPRGAFGERKKFKYFLFQNMGRRYYERHDINKARRAFYKAFCYNPFSLPLFVYNITRTFLPPQVVKIYRDKKKTRVLRNPIKKNF